MATHTVVTTEETCHYCNGDGYNQLLLGGSETCQHCKGSGKMTHKG
ncbi:YuiA family protein [Desmospora profundinema]|uniref:DnaJ-class molecular chaperone n=1 Tax=Desmospora profundinema TaxID=1571184 RepID=A0ABU1INF8_9BACL|nr:YuiA family protein [Desmospora profundinema]MDR6226317.1 DnaJ-class molecular chaperone [Desmospora profundinema]